jgi:hypothetical protein
MPQLENTFTAGGCSQLTSIIAAHIQNEGYRNLKNWCCSEILRITPGVSVRDVITIFKKRVIMPVRINR